LENGIGLFLNEGVSIKNVEKLKKCDIVCGITKEGKFV